MTIIEDMNAVTAIHLPNPLQAFGILAYGRSTDVKMRISIATIATKALSNIEFDFLFVFI
jgi:hypothetical protein